MTGGPPDGDRIARAVLSATVEPGRPVVSAVAGDAGPQVTLDALRSGDPRLGETGAVSERAARADGTLLIVRAAGLGVRFVVPGDAEWPSGVDGLAHAGVRDGIGGVPFGLWVRGPLDLGAALDRGVAVVGARAASAYGTQVAAELAAGLAERGVVVASGAAYGIDGAAHRGALGGGGTSVAVLACGVDIAYPRGHGGLLERIAEDGAVVSELPPGAGPTRYRFLARNRVLAAACAGTVVVEAALRSGARSTARWAACCQRPLMVVPGPVTSALSAGCHEEVRAGAAQLVTCAADVLDLVGRLGADAVSERRGPDRPWDGLPPDLAAVFEALRPRAGTGVGELAATTGRPVPDCLAALARLELLGLAERAPEGWRVGRVARSAAAARRAGA